MLQCINNCMDYEQIQKYNQERDLTCQRVFAGDALDKSHLGWVLGLMDTTDDDIIRIECRLFLEYNSIKLARTYLS